MKGMKKFLSLLLCMMMVIGMLPMSAFADETTDTVDLTAEFTEVQAFVDYLMDSNDPETVVKNFKTHFTWDNEKRENSKTTLFDWSYYNGVVFEGLEYLYENTKDEAYKNYVMEYMSSLIASDGSWAKCNNSSYTCSGYDGTHGGDTIKTASLLLDAYEMSGDSRYLTMAATIYKDITTAAGTYSLPNAGYNLRHTWKSGDPAQDLWLDGLYMVLPFRAEYAKHIGDTEELDLIVDRLQWVSDNMYDSSKGLFYHAANSDKNNSGSYWLRSMGWYAAAVVDVMDSYADDLNSEDFIALKAQLKKLIDGLYGSASAENGYMWLNAPAFSYNKDNNPYETSGASLIYYAVMKAVNNGWLDESYAAQAISCFEYMVDKKLTNNVLTDICFKGAPSTSSSANSEFEDNEGKGVGPFIMLYAELLEYTNTITSIVVTPPTTVTYKIGDTLDTTGMEVYGVQRDGDKVDLTDKIEMDEIILDEAGTQSITVTYNGMTATFEVTVEDVPVVDYNVTAKVEGTDAVVEAVVVPTTKVADKVASVLDTANLVAYDISVEDFEEGQTAEVTIPMPADVDATKFMVWYVGDDDTLEPMNGHPNADGTYTFTTTHFSVYVGGEYEGSNTDKNTGTGNLESEGYYELATSIESGAQYLIVSGNSGSPYVLYNNGSNGRQQVTVSNGEIAADFTNESSARWTFTQTGDNWYVTNGSDYLRINSNNNQSDVISGSEAEVTVTNRGNGAYRISSSGYLRYYNNTWQARSYQGDVYLFKYFPGSNGEAVEFTVTPSSVTLAPGGEATLTSTVTVGGEVASLNNCDIAFAIQNNAFAEIDEGTNNTIKVTGVTDGTTRISAILSAVNGTALAENIVLTIPVTVASRTPVSSADFIGESVRVKVGVTPTFNNTSATVTFDNDTVETLTVADKGLAVDTADYDLSNPGTYICDVYVTGTDFKVGTVTVEVYVDYNDYEDATVYPEYPNNGAVRIDKTASHNADYFRNTGVTRVELDVAGITSSQAIDVVLTIDVSNSMAWEVGTKNDNFERNKLTEVMESVIDFATIFLADQDDGTPTKNTISIVTFAGKDSDNWNNNDNYIDSVRTLVTQTSSLEVVKEIADNTKFTGKVTVSGVTDYGLQVAYIPDTEDQNIVGNVVVDRSSINRGDTNYDYAFWQTEQTVNDIKTANGSDSTREIHVLFMTDGCASNFNGAYYRTKNVAHAFVPGTSTTYSGTDYANGTAWTDYILNTLIKNNGGNTYAKSLYSKIHGMYAVGFDMANGSFTGITTWDTNTDWEKVFNDIVAKSVTNAKGDGIIPVTPASDTTTLKNFYSSLAHELRYPGTAAKVTDTIGSKFTLQMASFSGSGDKTATLTKKPTIAVTEYDLWTRAETSDMNLIGTRKGGEYVNTLEEVSFNDAGTEAYSSLNPGVNIMTINADGSVVINAKYFTYNKTAAGVETFSWNIGKITDKEIALSFDAYLKGALEGNAPENTYYTNEEAVLDYIDVNNKHAQQVFEIPAVVWGGASTTIRFYLVNEKGEPVNHAGTVVPWANRVYVGESVNVKLNLNQDMTIPAQTIEAAAYVPGEYFLYDNNASYTVQTASGEIVTGNIIPSAPSADAYKTTTDDNGNKTTQTGAQTTIVIDKEGTYFTWSIVGFGVRYDLSSEKITPHTEDKVVIDYGKPIDIDIFANDTKLVTDGWTSELVGFVKYAKGTNVEYVQSNAGSSTFTTANGKFSIVDGKVRYTLTNMLSEVEKVFAVVKYIETDNTDNFHYRYNTLTVIPATSVYYETDFADVVGENNEVTSNVFKYVDTWTTESKGDVADGPQDDGTVGLDQTYGYDSSYENDAYLSNGTSRYVEGLGKNKTTTTFEFTGTGFDIISRTGANEGLIQVVVTDSTGAQVKAVSVLNKSESNLELYQIPVLSIEGLTYGTYTATIHVFNAITSYPDAYAALNRGNHFFFDAVRIYNPAQNNAEATAAYAEDGEANMFYREVKQYLLDAKDYDVTTDNSFNKSGVTFVDCPDPEYVSGKPATGNTSGSVEIGTYETIGPNNEVYLDNNQGIVFQLTTESKPTSVDIGVKSIEGTTAHMQAYVATNASVPTTAKCDTDITASTAQNYALVNADNASTFEAGKPIYVFIRNTGSGVLSITDLKVGYGDTAATAGEIDFESNPETLAFAVACMSYEPEVEEPEEIVPEEPEYVLNYDVLAAQFDSTKTRLLKSTTMTVVTTQDVESVTVTDKYGLDKNTVTTGYVDNADGTRTWTVTVRPIMIGKQTYTVTGAGADGTTGASATAKINVKLF